MPLISLFPIKKLRAYVVWFVKYPKNNFFGAVRGWNEIKKSRSLNLQVLDQFGEEYCEE